MNSPYREPSPMLLHWDEPQIGDDVRYAGDKAVGTIIKRGWFCPDMFYVWVDFWGYWAWAEDLMVVNRPVKDVA